jgi:hypothetical protein
LLPILEPHINKKKNQKRKKEKKKYKKIEKILEEDKKYISENNIPEN